MLTYSPVCTRSELQYVRFYLGNISRKKNRDQRTKNEMGRYGCFVPLLLLISAKLLLSHGKTSGTCISPGGRFPPFRREGKPPTKVSKGSRDLNLCRVFRKNTCCDRTQTLPAFLTIRRLASTGEANQDCLQLWELLECSICDPRVGVKPGPPVICASLCDKVYDACSSAYFSMDAKTQVLAPCGSNDFVCGRASEWISNGTELCRIAGFSVMKSDDPEEPLCFGGKATTSYIADSWKVSQSSGAPLKTESSGKLEDFKQWVESTPFVERVSWAVGGMVLTAGLIFFTSRKKSHNQRQKQLAIQRTARKLGTRLNSGSLDSHGNRRGNWR